MKVNGKTTRWKDKVHLHGQTIESILANTLMIRRKDKVCSSGLMAENTRVSGKMENNMVLAFTHQPLEKLKEVDGLKERE